MKTILCTLGPASLTEDVIRQLEPRVDVFRVNLSHMAVESVEPTIAFVRRCTDKRLCLDTDGSQESMVLNRVATIAEPNDVINTLLDGAHGLLAAETTIGSNPVASVELVASLIEAFERSRGRSLIMPQPGGDHPRGATQPLQAVG